MQPPGTGLLSPSERDELTNCEVVIYKGLSVFVEVGNALMRIRNGRLYREHYATFHDYCKSRWQFGGARAYQLIGAADIAQSLEREIRQHSSQHIAPIIPLPTNPAIAYELRGFSTEVQTAIWLDVIQRAKDGAITAPFVREIADGYRDALYNPATQTNYNVHFSSESDDWLTPDWIIELTRNVLGEIELDPCSDEGLNVPALRHYTRAHDGLNQSWESKTLYLNPPYGREIELWIMKLVDEFRRGYVKEAIALLPSRTDRVWFQHLDEYSRCFLRGRLRFSNYDNSAPFPSVVVYLGRHHDRFASVFTPFGSVWQAQRNVSHEVKPQEQTEAYQLTQQVIKFLTTFSELTRHRPEHLITRLDNETTRRLILAMVDGRLWFSQLEQALENAHKNTSTRSQGRSRDQ